MKKLEEKSALELFHIAHFQLVNLLIVDWVLSSLSINPPNCQVSFIPRVLLPSHAAFSQWDAFTQRKDTLTESIWSLRNLHKIILSLKKRHPNQFENFGP